jgi:hypothetical protein
VPAVVVGVAPAVVVVTAADVAVMVAVVVGAAAAGTAVVVGAAEIAATAEIAGKQASCHARSQFEACTSVLIRSWHLEAEFETVIIEADSNATTSIGGDKLAASSQAGPLQFGTRLPSQWPQISPLKGSMR